MSSGDVWERFINGNFSDHLWANDGDAPAGTPVDDIGLQSVTGTDEVDALIDISIDSASKGYSVPIDEVNRLNDLYLTGHPRVKAISELMGDEDLLMSEYCMIVTGMLNSLRQLSEASGRGDFAQRFERAGEVSMILAKRFKDNGL